MLLQPWPMVLVELIMKSPQAQITELAQLNTIAVVVYVHLMMSTVNQLPALVQTLGQCNGVMTCAIGATSTLKYNIKQFI
jgi:hypothetical protein